MTHECIKCGATFPSRLALGGHMTSAHNRKRPPARHGTEYGYRKHLRERQVPCASCKKAHSLRMKKWRRGVRKQRA